MMHLSKVIHIWETLFGYMIQKIIIFFMHRKLLPVCLEGKYVAIVQQTPSTQKIQKRNLLIVQNIHSQFFVLMLVKRSEYSIIFSLFLVVVIMGVTMLSKSMKIDNTQKMQTLRFGF